VLFLFRGGNAHFEGACSVPKGLYCVLLLHNTSFSIIGQAQQINAAATSLNLFGVAKIYSKCIAVFENTLCEGLFLRNLPL
jgi:hypothetical protein